jgi:hypothetical protein
MISRDADDPWRDDGEPEPLQAWLRAGFGREEAEVWRGWRFMLAHARAWQAAGVRDGLEAAQWTTAGVSPGSVEQWRWAGIDATEAVRWHEFGFDLPAARRHKAKGRGPDEAFQRPGRRGGATATAFFTPAASRGAGPIERFMDAGIPGELLQSYLVRKWLDDEAFAWAKANVDAGDARLWQQLRIRPEEAGRLIRQGRTVADVVRDWWRAGIPFDEVADWIGAGLSAQEAAAQRAKGITAEQAAALRALRDDPPE